jgi:hypothetical protein
MDNIDDEMEHNEYRKQLGIVGVQMMRLSDEGDKLLEEDRSSSDVFEGRKTNSLVDVDNQSDAFVDAMIASQDQLAFNLVERMKATTFKVRITNALADLVEPLVSRLNISQEEIEAGDIRRHHEIGMYLDKILQAVDNLDKSADSNRGWYLATKDFFRHPELYIGRAVVKGIVATFKFGFGALFGFKKEKSDTDRIVDAIEKQTEWHMTNSVDQSRGFFERLKAQGVLGMGVRGIANLGLRVAGVDKKKAQAQEDARASGEAVPRSVRGVLSDIIYKSDITKKGRLGTVKTAVKDDNQPTDVVDQTLFDLMRSQFSEHMRRLDTSIDLQRYLLVDLNDGMFKQGDRVDMSSWREEPSFEIVSKNITTTSDEVRQVLVDGNSKQDGLRSLVENITDRRVTYELERDKMRDLEKEDNDVFSSGQKDREHTLIELIKNQESGIFDIVKNTKAVKDEVRRTRLQAMWQSVVGFGASLVSGVMGLLATAGTIVGALFPLKLLGGIFTAVGAKIVAAVLAGRGKLAGGLGRAAGKTSPKAPTPPPSVPTVGGGVGGTLKTAARFTPGALIGSVAMGAIGSTLEDGSKSQGAFNILDNVITGASIGGLAGGAMGAGVGAVPGAIVGGLAGLGTGIYSNWDAFTSKDDPQDTPFTPVSNGVNKLTDVVSTVRNSEVNVFDTTASPVNKLTDVVSTVRNSDVNGVNKLTDVEKPFNPVSNGVNKLTDVVSTVRNSEVNGVNKLTDVVSTVRNSEVNGVVNKLTDVEKPFNPVSNVVDRWSGWLFELTEKVMPQNSPTFRNSEDSLVTAAASSSNLMDVNVANKPFKPVSNGINRLTDASPTFRNSEDSLVTAAASSSNLMDVNVANAVNTITPVSGRLIAASESVKNKAVSVGAATAEFVAEQSNTLTTHFKAVQDGLSMHGDVIKEAMDGIRKKTEESLTAIRDGNKTSREIVGVLKGILENTKASTSKTVQSPFGDIGDSGFLKNVLGR